MDKYISEKKLSKALMEYSIFLKNTCSKAFPYFGVMAVIDNISPADVKHIAQGKWIWKPDKRWWECDQCGERTIDACMGKPRANYCPWCGLI